MVGFTILQVIVTELAELEDLLGAAKGVELLASDIALEGDIVGLRQQVPLTNINTIIQLK